MTIRSQCKPGQRAPGFPTLARSLILAVPLIALALPARGEQPVRLAQAPATAVPTPAEKTPPTQRGAVPDSGRIAALPDFSSLMAQQGPAVVNVVTSRSPSHNRFGAMGGEDEALSEFLRRFFPDTPNGQAPSQPTQGLGSGFIISPDGLILTNAHVVADAEVVLVRMADGKKEFKGKVLGADSRSDVALIKIDAQGLPVARLGKSSSVKPGQWVAAIGSPFGFTNTITAGIVGATGRTLPDETYVSFIQTDVAVNPGNSGGPLLNLQGEVIGVNSIIYSRTGGYMGVSFAIPIELALDVAKQLQTQGKVSRGRLGVVIQPVTSELAQVFKLDSPSGALVSQVEPGSPADKAQIRSGDIILTYNGKAVQDGSELPRLVAATRPGNQAKLEIWRNGARRTLGVTIGELQPEQAEAQPATPPGQPPNRLGLALKELTPDQMKQLEIDHGLLVESVHGPATRTPIRPGDVVMMFNQTRVSSLEEFNRLLAGEKPGNTVALLVRRGPATTYIPMQVISASKEGE